MTAMGAVSRRLRRIGATAAGGVLLVGLAVGPSTAPIMLVDLPGGGYGSGSGYGSPGGSTAAVDTRTASASESRGVVLIDTALYDGSQAAGTGIVLTASGEVLTNYHVVEGSTAIRVTVASTGRTYTASLVGADSTSDVAVLKLSGASGLATASIDNDSVAVGDDVTAVGNAGGTGTLSAADGDVTALGAEITTAAEGSVAGETLTNLIETDADVVPGDSGGPLLDSEGEVVGIDTAASTGSEIDGYAIPIDTALTIVDQINAGDETDQVRIGPAAYLGVQVADDVVRSQDADPYGSGVGGSIGQADTPGSRTSGAAVVGVGADTPAARAGIAAGDLITAVGSTAIGSASELTSVLSRHQPGDRVTITWVDGAGAEQSATVTLGSSPVN